MTEVERAENEAQMKQITKKVEMERENKTVIGDINSYAFLKSSQEKQDAKAAPSQI